MTMPKRPQIHRLTILFEDADLIAISKPSGLLSHASVDRSRPDAFRLLQEQLNSRDQAPCRLSLAHRIDVGTSGLLLFSKSADLHEAVAELFRSKQIHKEYVAVVHGRPSAAAWSVRNYLKAEKIPGSKSLRARSVRSGGDAAWTDFKILRQHAERALVLARIHTGRRHQIRAHLAESGLPILGDSLYGGPPAKRIWLHSWKLEFQHPRTKETLHLEDPLPADFPLQF